MNKVKHAVMGSGLRDEVLISGFFVLGGAGAISSTDGFCSSQASGVSPGVVKKAGTARYTVTLDRSYKSLRLLGAPGLVGDTTAAFGNTNANTAQYRNRTAGTGNATPASFDIQLFLASSGVDTDAPSGTEIHWSCVARAY